MTFTTADGRVTAIDAIGEPERVKALEVVLLDV